MVHKAALLLTRQVWDLRTQKVLYSLHGHTDTVSFPSSLTNSY
jgi:hypothetical protein